MCIYYTSQKYYNITIRITNYRHTTVVNNYNNIYEKDTYGWTLKLCILYFIILYLIKRNELLHLAVPISYSIYLDEIFYNE